MILTAIPLCPLLDASFSYAEVERIMDLLQTWGYPMTFEEGSALILRGDVLGRAIRTATDTAVPGQVTDRALFIIGTNTLIAE